jgi:hypothetical protein
VAIFMSLLLWRLFYVRFLASSRFVKKVILICDKDQAQELVMALESVDPHYKVMGYVNSDLQGDNEKNKKGLYTKH